MTREFVKCSIFSLFWGQLFLDVGHSSLLTCFHLLNSAFIAVTVLFLMFTASAAFRVVSGETFFGWS